MVYWRSAFWIPAVILWFGFHHFQRSFSSSATIKESRGI